MNVLLPLLMVALLLPGCGRRGSAQARETVVLTAVQIPHGSVLHVAAAQGAFAEAGLDVVLQPHPFGKVALEALLEGRADLATCADTPFVLAVLRKVDVVVLASLSTTSKDAQLIALKAAGIQVPGDLVGKTIGVSFGTSGDFFLDSLLVRHRIPRQAITRVNLDPAQMAAALAERRVDAVSTWNPTCLRLKEQFGDRVSAFTAEDVYLQAFVLVGKRSYVASHRSAVEKVLRGLLKAERFMRTHPTEAQHLVAQSLAIPPEDIAQVWGLFDFQVRLDQRHLVIMNEEARWAIRTGMVPGQPLPDFLAHLDPAPLDTVEPRAVRLMR